MGGHYVYILLSVVLISLFSAFVIAPPALFTCDGIDADSVDPLACNGHGVCTDTDDCTCDDGWEGTFCGDVIVESVTCDGIAAGEDIVCNGHGVCTDTDVCTCYDGWEGTFCGDVIVEPVTCYGIEEGSVDPLVCNGNGDCVAEDNCYCDEGWTGDTCELVYPLKCFGSEADSACSGDGECVEEDACFCDAGFYGSVCQKSGTVTCDGVQSHNKDVCSGNGVCVGQDTCECFDLFEGEYCEEEITPVCSDAENGLPCSGNGECIGDNVCKCEPRYVDSAIQGDCSLELWNCYGGQLHTDTNPSSGCINGICIAQDTCNCDEDWGARICDVFLPLTMYCDGILSNNPLVCSGRGKCTSSGCECYDSEFSGSSCQNVVECNGIDALAEGVCSGHGACLITGDCHCDDGWEGLDCAEEQITCFGSDASDPSVCSGNGNCNALDTCECNAGYSGDNCSSSSVLEKWFCNGVLFTDCSACSGSDNGYCAFGGNCVCKAGYEGTNCETVINTEHQCFGKYASDPAACNGGTCTSTDKCTCPAGFTGAECTEPVDCSGIGGCVYGICVGENVCQCTLGFLGLKCDGWATCFDEPSYSSASCADGDCVAEDTCVCDDYHYGLDCSTPYYCYGVHAESALVCSGQGDCAANDDCVCDYGWEGDTCNWNKKECEGVMATNDDVCNTRGVCKDDGTETWKCFCDPGYDGVDCDHPNICGGQEEPLACNGDKGICVKDNVCECVFPYTGSLCEDFVYCDGVIATDYDNVCSGFGQCMKTGLCSCDDEHTGVACSEKIQCLGKYYDDPDVCGGVQICTKDGCAPDPNNGSCDPSVDSDGDGYDNDVDCDDTDDSIYPGAVEIAGDEIDQNCDGLETCYLDADDDGYRPDISSTVASADLDCIDPGEAVSSDPTTDCNDGDGTINPVADEVWYNGVDNDCDGSNDYDQDEDGYVGAAYDGMAGGTAPNTDDCNDNASSINPGAVEIVDNGIDDNCDGNESCYLDADDDGYRPDTTSTVASADLDCIDPGEAVSSDPTTDCNDNNPAAYPNATEVCDHVDNDCNREVDENVTTTYYLDFDGDGFGDINSTIQDCSLPLNYTLNNTDCNDNSSAVCPNATEVCGNGIDEDCDGVDTTCPPSGGGGGGGGGSYTWPEEEEEEPDTPPVNPAMQFVLPPSSRGRGAVESTTGDAIESTTGGVIEESPPTEEPSEPPKKPVRRSVGQVIGKAYDVPEGRDRSWWAGLVGLLLLGLLGWMVYYYKKNGPSA
ncbi:MopE-related protein [Nanoarchaeota archaeon]